MASHGVPTTLRAFLTLSPLPYRHSFNQRETKQSLFAHRSSESEHPMHREGEELGKIYQKKSPAEHVLLRPDTYIGTTQFVDHEHWVFNESEKRMQKKACRYVPGLYKIFDEILVNANDNRQRDSKMSTIKVDIDPVQGLIEIENDGKGIPVALHPTENCYIPELVLGNLLTGSNFDDTIAKITGGRNGYGAKLTNIFSLLFTVETYDSQRGLHYVQTWKNNMTERGNPIVILLFSIFTFPSKPFRLNLSVRKTDHPSQRQEKEGLYKDIFYPRPPKVQDEEPEGRKHHRNHKDSCI